MGVVACNGSPMAIGVGVGSVYVHSDAKGFDLTRVEVAHADEEIAITPAPYPHWTIRECEEQPQAIARALGFGGRLNNDRVVLGGMDAVKERLAKIRHLLITGCGTSLFAGMYGAILMRKLHAFDTIQTCDAAEIKSRNFPPAEEGGLAAISQSGETRDVFKAVTKAEKAGLPVFSVVNAVGS